MNINNNVNVAVQNAKWKNNMNKVNASKNIDASKLERQQELKEACQEFEAIFTNMMLKEMRKSIQDSGLTEKSSAREMFEDMYFEEMSKDMSKGSNGTGLAKMLYDSMKNRI